jgi:UTP-glucose-1-phosphate uridylyltransferase
LIRRLLDRREKVVGRVFHGDWIDIGQPQDYMRAVENCECLFNAATLAVDTVLPPTNGYHPELAAVGSQST